jgi:hypothetical protein
MLFGMFHQEAISSTVKRPAIGDCPKENSTICGIHAAAMRERLNMLSNAKKS